MIKLRCPECESYLGINSEIVLKLFSNITYVPTTNKVVKIRHEVMDFNSDKRTFKADAVNLYCNHCGIEVSLDNSLAQCDKCSMVTGLNKLNQVGKSLNLCTKCVESLKGFVDLSFLKSDNNKNEEIEEEIEEINSEVDTINNRTIEFNSTEELVARWEDVSASLQGFSSGFSTSDSSE